MVVGYAVGGFGFFYCGCTAHGTAVIWCSCITTTTICWCYIGDMAISWWYIGATAISWRYIGTTSITWNYIGTTANCWSYMVGRTVWWSSNTFLANCRSQLRNWMASSYVLGNVNIIFYQRLGDWKLYRLPCKKIITIQWNVLYGLMKAFVLSSASVLDADLSWILHKAILKRRKKCHR